MGWGPDEGAMLKAAPQGLNRLGKISALGWKSTPQGLKSLRENSEKPQISPEFGGSPLL
jgi:hypothetical protein